MPISGSDSKTCGRVKESGTGACGFSEKHRSSNGVCRHRLFRRNEGKIPRDTSREPAWTAADEADVGTLLISGYPDRLAIRVSDDIFRFASGRQASTSGGLAAVTGSLASADFIIAPDADAGELSGTIYLAAPVTKTAIEEKLAALISEEREISWNNLTPRAVVSRRIGKIILAERKTAVIPRNELALSFERLIRERGLGYLPWDDDSRRFLARCRFTSIGGRASAFPSFSDETLITELDSWLLPQLKSGTGPVLDARTLRSALESRLSWNERSVLEREAPEHVRVPSGMKRKISYEDPENPVLAVRIQEVFGLAESPRISGKPVVLHLLSPAQRPLQITRDLSSFWKNTYPEVRKEMRGRYPKHYWPENPLEAEPTTGAKKRVK